MSKNKFTSRRPAISTASLPDIIFMLLFFFMVVTVMQDTTLKVKIVIPEATELTKLEKASLITHFYIGTPEGEFVEEEGSAPRLQLGDKFADVEDIPAFLLMHEEPVPEYQRGLITASLRIDRDIQMGIVTDVKIALCKAGQYKVNYSANRKQEL